MNTPEPGSELDEHLTKCGPFCTHIEFCPACVEVRGVCAGHAADPSKGFRWVARQTQEAGKP
jgi:hypothetical protein